MDMNKYQEALKRLEGMVLTSPFKNDGGDGVVDMNDMYKCGTQLQNEYLHDLNVLKELVDKAESFEWIPVEERLPEPSLNSVLGWDAYRERCCFVQYYNNEWILGNHESVKIVAWMLLPKYKEKENDIR